MRRTIFVGYLALLIIDRELTIELQQGFLRLHEDLQKRLTDGYNRIGDEIKGSKDDIQVKVDQLLSQQDATTNDPYLDLISGHEDIVTTLERICKTILDANSEEKAVSAQNMMKLLLEQNDMTQLLTSVLQK